MTPADAVIWPASLNRPLTNKFNLAAATFSPGQTTAGAFPLGRMDGGGVWVGTLAQIILDATDDVLAFLALSALADGGITPIVVPRKMAMLAPWPLDAHGNQITSYGSIPHSDGSFFSDGAGYEQPVIVAATVGDASLRDTTLQIGFTNGGPARGVFSINHPVQGWRMYTIKTSVLLSPGLSQVTFIPPLRDDVASNSPVEFDMPRCIMRLAKSDAADFEFATFPFPRPTVTFLEYFFLTS